MKQNGRITAFLCGVFCAVLVVAMINPAVAAMVGKTIEVYTGIQVYVNDQLVEPKDVNGNPVEVFVYNGTTYLPIRAIGNALGLPVQYEASTKSAFVGKHVSEKPAVWLTDLDYFSGSSSISVKTTHKDNTGAAHNHCINDDFERTYLINGQYSAISGVLYQPYDTRSGTIFAGAGLEIYGDGELLYSYTFDTETTGLKPVNFHVDLSGVLELKVVLEDGGYYYSNRLAIGDVGLWS